MATVLFKTVGIYKFVTNIGGNAPTFGSSDGIAVGDRVIDNSTTPYKVWTCVDNTDGSAVYIQEYPSVDVKSSAKNYNSDGVAGELSYHGGYLYICLTTGTGGSGRWGRTVFETAGF